MIVAISTRLKLALYFLRCNDFVQHVNTTDQAEESCGKVPEGTRGQKPGSSVAPGSDGTLSEWREEG